MLPRDPSLPIADRVAGGLVGLLVGDALGVPFEFRAPERIPPLAAIEFAPPLGYDRAHIGIAPGTWSDDGAHALALADSLLTRGTLDLADLGARLLAWYDGGAYAVDGRVFDVGIQTSRALSSLAAGRPARECGPADVFDNGNGALMRVLPLALWHDGPDAELVHLAHEQGLPTHGHVRSQVSCAAYCLWARAELRGDRSGLAGATRRLAELYAADTALATHLHELHTHVAPGDRAAAPRGTGYVVDCLRSASWAVEGADGYELAVRRAISLGNDTDTTACVAGGIAGVRWGRGGIPARWRDTLRGAEILAPVLAGLVGRGG
ncbi:MAG: ADP-ribosylglycohydrolase family protein [Myxococcota bacterium]